MPHTYTCTGGIKCREVHERVKITCLWVVVMRDNFLMLFSKFSKFSTMKMSCFLKKEKRKACQKCIRNNNGVLYWIRTLYTRSFKNSEILNVWNMGFPVGSTSKVFTFNSGDLGLIPGSERSPGEGHGNPWNVVCMQYIWIRGWAKELNVISS